MNDTVGSRLLQRSEIHCNEEIKVSTKNIIPFVNKNYVSCDNKIKIIVIGYYIYTVFYLPFFLDNQVSVKYKILP